MERGKNIALGVLLALFAAALALHPGESAEAARQGLRLCFETVLPSLFPFFVLSSLFLSTGAAARFGHALEGVMRPLFRLSGAGAGALVLGLAGGYPVGARTAAELYRRGSLTREEAERLLSFCNNAGPGFVMGICGGAVFGSVRAGALLCLIHAVSALLTGFLLSRPGRAPQASAARGGSFPAAPEPRAGLFPAAVRDSFAAAWSVCGFVVIFAVLLRFLSLILPPHPLLLGFAELTNGVLALSPDRGGFMTCAALLGWGGLSVHAQTLSVLEDTDLSPRRYFLGKAVQALLSLPLARLASMWLF